MSNKNDKLISFKDMYEYTLAKCVKNTVGFSKTNAINKLGSLQYNFAVEEGLDDMAKSQILYNNLEQYREITTDDDTEEGYTDDYLELFKTANIEELRFESSLNDPKKFVTAYLKKRKLAEGTSDNDQDIKPPAKPNNLFPRQEKTDPIATKPNNQPTRSKFVMKTPTVQQPIASVVPRQQNVQKTVNYPQTSGYVKNVRMDVDTEPKARKSDFVSATTEFVNQNIKKYGTANPPSGPPLFAYNTTKKTLGGRPVQNRSAPQRNEQKNIYGEQKANENNEIVDERLQHIDPKMIELIRSEIMDKFDPIDWNAIAGLNYAKQIIMEAVVWPLLRPDMFTGLRRPPKGILLFGPPGTGKTLIGKCIASQSKATFFSISASSLTSKWIGDGEKMVKALFQVALVHQPSVIFIDEIDSLLCQRNETEHESSRRIKTEFLVQLDGAATSEKDRILIVGATNRPQELDEAARRRLVKRLYIPLPEHKARQQILTNLLALPNVDHCLTPSHVDEIATRTEGFSGADMKTLCEEAAMMPLRSIPFDQFTEQNKLRAISFNDFESALTRIRASVSPDDLAQYIKWNNTYGSGTTNVK